MLINNDTIIKDDNPLIREKSVNVNLPLSKEDEQLLLDMYNYVDESTDETLSKEKNLRPAVGISAIQVGVRKKLTAIIIKNENGEKVYDYALVNPKIVSHSIEKTYLKAGEGCLSVDKEHQGYIHRYARIRVKAYDYFKKENVELKLSGYIAVVFQHELEHFNGVLFYDHINSLDPMYIEDGSIAIE